MKYKIAWALALVLVLAISLAPGSAGAAGVEIVYELNFGDPDFHRTTWNRLEVSVLNNSGDDLQGSVVVDAGGEYIQEVFIQAGARGTVVFYLPPADISEGWQTTGIGITVRNTRGRELAGARVNAMGYGPQSSFAGVLGRSTANFARLANVLHNTKVVKMEPGHLDHLPFAQNFKVIIVNDPGTISLSPGQKENLQRWVDQGGVLILGGGSGWQSSANLVPSDLLPVQPRGVETISGSDLSGLQLPVAPTGEDYSVATGDLRGAVLLQGGDRPLLVKKAWGEGAVLWSALNLDAAPLDHPANSEAFWEKVFMLQPPLSRSSGLQQPWTINQIFNSLSQDGIASVLSPLRILLLLLGYIILVGPVNWLVLRKLDRREWAWLTIPVLALLFTTGAFAAGRIGRGSERIHYQLNMVTVHSENLASLRSFNGVFVPRRGGISLTAPVAAITPQGAGIVRGLSGETSLEFVNPPLWSVQRFYVEDYLQLPGKFTVAARLEGSAAGQFHAEVVNNSGYDLFDSYIRLGKQWYSVGPLQAGEKKASSAASVPMLNFGDILQHYTNSSHAWYEIGQMLPEAPVLFIGFGDDGLVELGGTGDHVALNLWMQPMGMDAIALSQGSLDIPPGILIPVITGGDGANAINEKWADDLYFDGQGSFDLVFTFPEKIDYGQGEFRVNFQNLWGEAQGSLLAYNQVQGEWQELTSLTNLYKSQSSVLLENPGDLVRDQRLTLRISYNGSIGMSVKGLDITVKGGRILD